MAPSSPPTINPRHFIVIASISSVVLVAILLLWLFDVVPVGVFFAGLVVVAVGQGTAVMLLLRSARRRASRAEQPPGGTSTIGPDSPAARYGYDPMDDLGGDSRR